MCFVDQTSLEPYITSVSNHFHQFWFSSGLYDFLDLILNYLQNLLEVALLLCFEFSLQGHLGSVSSSESLQQTPGTVQMYGSSRPSETSVGVQGTISSYRSSSTPMGQYALQRDNVFPERPDQPECQFYMKTGDCKFGAACKFHHPKERLIPAPNCLLSPSGLPLRPVSYTVMCQPSYFSNDLI